MSKKAMIDDTFSCDLVHQSKCHILFLSALHSEGITLHRPSLESLRRYKDLWLPLFFHNRNNGSHGLTEGTGSDLIPPSDVAWLWHCHRLAPYRYMDYVEATYFQSDEINHGQESLDAAGKMSTAFERFHQERPFIFQSLKTESVGLQNEVKDHDDSEYVDSCSYTQALWKKLYPHESFFLEGQDESAAEEDKNNATMMLFGDFDVLDSCERQSAFLWQVSGDRYRDDAFLLQGVENYKKFLRLITSKPRPKFLVPTYQIDLMWHTHMLTSITKYHTDCLRMTRSIVEHNDSLTDRSEGGILDVNFQATKKLWYEQYGTDYTVRGGMYRGEPPQAFYNNSTTWIEQYFRNGTLEDTTISTKVLLDGLSFEHLIGKVGASSVMLLSSDTSPWMSLDEPNAFIAAQPKSKTKGENANGFMEGYVFGSGGEMLTLGVLQPVLVVCMVLYLFLILKY